MLFTKIINKINYFYILGFAVLLCILPELGIILENLFSYKMSFDIVSITYFTVFIQLILYVLNLLFKTYKIDKFDILVYILIIFNMITCNIACDMTISIWGAYGRNEGFLALLTYYLLFLNTKNLIKENNSNKYFVALIIIGIIEFILCVYQIFIEPFLNLKMDISMSHMAIGSIGNANFFGALIVLLLGLVTAKYLLNKKNVVCYFILTIIFYICLILAQSTGPFLGYVFMLILLIVYLIVKKRINLVKIMILIPTLIMVFISINIGVKLYYKNAFNRDIDKRYTIAYDLGRIVDLLVGKFYVYDLPPIEKTKTIEEDEFGKEIEKIEVIKPEITEEQYEKSSSEYNLNGFGSGRVMIWRNTLKLIPNYIWFGCGIDNFSYVYKWNYEGVYYDKAHNNYLQILITEGIFALITYLLLLFFIIKDGIKSNKNICIVLLCGIFAYVIQDFTNISSINVSPIFFIVCGMVVGISMDISKKRELNK